MKYYKVPQHVAEELNLTRFRTQDSDGYYIVSHADIATYGIKKALSERSVEISRADAKKRVRKVRNLNKK